MRYPTTTDTCGCCEGVEILTPQVTANRPGLNALFYRVGVHATFLETMIARLSSFYLELPGNDLDPQGHPIPVKIYPLRDLKTRAESDPSIALLDAWACVAAVLTFYQERIANEGYLRTATERRSILELARLVGYELRPGVSATVYLAYLLENGHRVEVPVGSRAQSVPAPGGLPQTFETADPLKARAEWNNLKPRLSQPQVITPITDTLYLEGVTTNLKPNDPLLIDFRTERRVYFVQSVEPDAEANHTKIVFTTRGAIDPELGGLQRLVQDAEIPEEEGPYSVVIGARAASEIQQAILRLIPLLQDESQPAGDLIRAINAEMPRLQQTIRVYKALNFEILEAWVNGIRWQLESIRRKLRLRPPGAGAPAPGPVDLDESRVRELLAQNPTSRKAFGKEIGAEEVKWNKAAMQTLLRTLADDSIDEADKVVAARGELLRLGQLVYVFDELGFTTLATWAKSLYDLLADAVPRSTLPLGSFQKVLVRANPLGLLIAPLLKPPALPPANALRLARDVREIFSLKSDTAPQLLVNLVPRLKPSLYQAWGSAAVVKPGTPAVYALRASASVFGYNAPKKLIPVENGNTTTNKEMPVILKPEGEWSPSEETSENANIIFLDTSYDKILPGSFIAIQRPDAESQVFAVEQAILRPRTAYGISGKTTEVHISDAWWDPGEGGDDADDFEIVRSTVVYAESEKLTLAEEPIETPLGPDPDDPEAATHIELDALYDGLASGQWLIVSGERIDIPGASGVKDAELVMLARVEQGFNPNLPSDTTHTTLILAKEGLSFNYKRDTVTIYGNVVKATHGETRSEVLGSGDGSQAFQQFILRQPPLTYVPAPNPSGAESTLQMRVNDLLWHETRSIAGLKPTDRSYITRTSDDGKTTVIFGNGIRGARLPTGAENVKALYRNGIGKGGNVKGGQISLLMSKPLGVKEVINPLPATGGADKETRDQARRNVPLAVKALDRLVSVQDYADFARTFAGIGKASAARLSDGRRQVVHVTIAGAEDIPIDKNSDLYRNLRLAFYRFGEPQLPVVVKLRELALLVISARVRLQPDYLWEAVEPKVRSAMLGAFSFERRELGQDVLLSEVISVIQNVPGVAFVDVELLDSIAESVAKDLDALADKLEELTQTPPAVPNKRLVMEMDRVVEGEILPAQLAFLSPELPETLILEELPQ